MTVVVPCIDGVGHCSYVPETGIFGRANCAEERGDSSVQFFGEVGELPVVVQRQVPGF